MQLEKKWKTMETDKKVLERADVIEVSSLLQYTPKQGQELTDVDGNRMPLHRLRHRLQGVRD